MYNKQKHLELIEKINTLPQDSNSNYKIYTKARKQLNLINIDQEVIKVATKKDDWRVFKEIPFYMFELTYNELEEEKSLTQVYIRDDLDVKRSAFIIAVFSLLDEIEYDESSNTIFWKNQN